jgi:hypothetical protein
MPDAPRMTALDVATISKAIDTGLDKAAALQVGRGDFQAKFGLKDEAMFARFEATFRPAESTTLFGYGEARALPGAAPALEAGIGARIRW